MADLKSQKFKRVIEQLASIRGRHTELVTVYVPAGSNLNTVADQIRAEQSTAQNIKSKQVRKNVMAALDKVTQHLKHYKQTPPKGLAIFCGNVSDNEGVSDIQIFVVEPVEDIKTRLYRCDQTFIMEPLKEMVEEKEIYGFIVLDKSEADIGILVGSRVEGLKHMESIVPGKTKKGGWSQARYARIREGLLNDFLKSVGDAASKEFKGMKNLIGIVIGGPGPIKEEFAEKEFMNYEVKNKLLGVVSTSYTGDYGLREMVDRSKDVIAQATAVKESELLERYFTELATDGLAVYGEADTLKYLRQGNMDTLIITEKYAGADDQKTEDLLKEAESMSTKVEVVSHQSQRGSQLQELGGIGGLIRYKT